MIWHLRIALAIELFLLRKKTKNCTMYFRCYDNHDILYNGRFFMLFFDILRNVERKNKKYKFLKFLLLTLMLLVIPFVINWILQDKVSSSSGEGSVSARSYDIQKCIQIGLDNLFFGKSLLKRTKSKP